MALRVRSKADDAQSSSSTTPLSPTSSRASKMLVWLSLMFLALSVLQLVANVSFLNVRSLKEKVHQNSGIYESPSVLSSSSPSKSTTTTIVNASSENETRKEFDYELFWHEAVETAKQMAPTLQQGKSCPKVYVYDNLPSTLTDTNERVPGLGKKAKMKRRRDKKFEGSMYWTHQYSFASILERRLLKTSCRTTNPDEADLFFAPILTAPKGYREWVESCQNTSAGTIRDALPFLNASNACRHIFAVGKGHYVAEACDGWWVNPIPELHPVQRLAYSERTAILYPIQGHVYENNASLVYPNLHSVPYPTSMHFRKSTPASMMPQFQKMDKRKVLMSFIGKDGHGDVPVREKIHQQCLQYNSQSICEYNEFFNVETATSKARSVFCLEPAGDSPWRKSMADSIAFGCIPVLFSTLTDDSAPWFWNDWKAHGRILVPREDFVAGRIDLQRLLQSIPSHFLELMRSTLIDKARQFQYSVDDDPNDGISLILDRLHQKASDMEQSGLCSVDSVSPVQE